MRTALTLVGFALAAYAAVVLLFYLKQAALARVDEGEHRPVEERGADQEPENPAHPC